MQSGYIPAGHLAPDVPQMHIRLVLQSLYYTSYNVVVRH